MKNLVDHFEDKFKPFTDKLFNDLNSMTLDEAIDKAKLYQKRAWILIIFFAVIELILFIKPVPSLKWNILLPIFFCALFYNLALISSSNHFLLNLISRKGDEYAEQRVPEMKKVINTRRIQRYLTVGEILNLPNLLTILALYEYFLNNPAFTGWTPAIAKQIVGNDLIFKLFLIAMPLAYAFALFEVDREKYNRDQERIDKALARKEYHNKNLKSMLSGATKEKQKELTHEPIMVIGQSIEEDGDDVYQGLASRRQNSIYYGPIGSGKTKTVFDYQIHQDIQYAICWIRDYPKISKQAGFLTAEGNIAHTYLNGLGVVETTDDLCRDVYNMAIKMGFPADKIVWIDPSNPRTPGFNMMRGPMDKVSESFTSVIVGITNSNQDFFAEAGRNHVKNYIYLLKFDSVITKEIPTLNTLIQMYNDVYLVVEKRERLRVYVEILNKKKNEAQEKFEELSKKIEERTQANPMFFNQYKNLSTDIDADSKIAKLEVQKEQTTDPQLKEDIQLVIDHANRYVYVNEAQNTYNRAVATLHWFDNNIQVQEQFNHSVQTETSGPHKGEPKYYDVNDEYIRGLRNILDDISKNQGLMRVLFHDSGQFNFDDVFANGGIVLCNTAKDVVGPKLAETLGGIYTTVWQDATMRRNPNNSVPMFPLYFDEFPDYLQKSFSKFIAQARKYNVPIILSCQSPTQLAEKYDEKWANTVRDNLLTVGVFGNMSPNSAKMFEQFFGTREKIVENVSHAATGLLSGIGRDRRQISSSIQEVPNITAEELMGMEKYTMAVRTPNPAKLRGSQLFNRVRTTFLTDKDIESDPNNFDLSDPNDRYDYMFMIQHQVHNNPDFQGIDTEIHKEYLEGKYDDLIQEESTSNQPAKKNKLNKDLDAYKVSSPNKDDSKDSPKKKNGSSPALNGANEDQIQAMRNLNLDSIQDKPNQDSSDSQAENSEVVSIPTSTDERVGKATNKEPNASTGVNLSGMTGSSALDKLFQKDVPASNDTDEQDSSAFAVMDDRKEAQDTTKGNDSDNKTSSVDPFKPMSQPKETKEPTQTTVPASIDVEKAREYASQGINPEGKNHAGTNRYTDKVGKAKDPFIEQLRKQKEQDQQVIEDFASDANKPNVEEDTVQPTQPTQPAKPIEATEPINEQKTEPKKVKTVKIKPRVQNPAPAQETEVNLPNGYQHLPNVAKKPDEKKEDNDMLHIRNNKLYEDKEDPEYLRKIREENKPNITKVRSNYRSDFEDKIHSILDDGSLSKGAQIDKLSDLKDKYAKTLPLIDPDEAPTMLKKLDNTISLLKKDLADGTITLDGNGNDFDKKMNDMSHNSSIYDQLTDMMDSLPDPNYDTDLSRNKTIKNAKTDPDFADQGDQFMHQHGMNEDE